MLTAEVFIDFSGGQETLSKLFQQLTQKSSLFGLFHSQNVDFFVHFPLSYFVLKREEQEDESEEFLELFENGINYVDGK